MIPRIALDAMSGDFGASVVVPAAVRVLAEHDSVELILVGDQATLTQMLSSLAPDMQRRLFIRHASQVVAMDEAPSNALRNKKDSSMRVAINLVKENTADACVSAGNTGALMATARYVLKTLPCIDRPAIISALPNMINGHTYMLDLGANVDVTPRHLLEFAIMGNVLASAIDNLPSPRVGLLNIGEEEIKGNECVKEASKLLATCPINYIGFVEGNDIFKGTVDVVVCDGFTGNVSLKTTEGVAKMISHYVKQSFTQTWFSKLAALIALPILKDLRRKIDPRRYNGASLLGLKGIVIKSHGGADELAFAYAIKEAINEVEKNVPRRIADQVAAYLTEQRQVE